MVSKDPTKCIHDGEIEVAETGNIHCVDCRTILKWVTAKQVETLTKRHIVEMARLMHLANRGIFKHEELCKSCGCSQDMPCEMQNCECVCHPANWKTLIELGQKLSRQNEIKFIKSRQT